MEGLKRLKLKNGMELYFRQREDLNSVSVFLWIKAGASYERENERGVAHFLEHVIFHESKKLGKGEIDRIVEELGGEINAATSYDYTYYYITLPEGNLETALELIEALIFHPVFSEEVVEKEKPIVLEEIARSKNDPQGLFTEEFLKKLYKRAPYRHPILGEPETVKGFTFETVSSFYKRFYSPERMKLVVVGNFDFSRALEVSRKLFEGKRGGGFKFSPQVERELKTGGRFTFKHPGATIPTLLLGWKLPPVGKDLVYYEILDSLLSSGRSSLLYRNLKSTGIAYSAYSNYQGLLFGSNFSVGVLSDSLEEAEREVYETLKKCLKVEEEEFELAKLKLLRGELFLRESGEGEADAIGFSATVLGKPYSHERYAEAVKRATKEEFLKKVSFLKKEPLTGVLLPQTL